MCCGEPLTRPLGETHSVVRNMCSNPWENNQPRRGPRIPTYIRLHSPPVVLLALPVLPGLLRCLAQLLLLYLRRPLLLHLRLKLAGWLGGAG